MSVDNRTTLCRVRTDLKGCLRTQSGSAPLLIDVQCDGRAIKGLVHPARNGYLWVLERTADAIKFVNAKPYVIQEVFTGLDPKTGRPSYDMDKKPATDKVVNFCPSLWGGKDWPPAAYSPQTGYLYVPANENLCSTLVGKVEPYERVSGTSALIVPPPR
jgi:alcohol dehydrogenase (cytochrome c)